VHPALPTRYFTSSEEAITWLTGSSVLPVRCQPDNAGRIKRAGSGPAGVFVPYLRAVVTREARKHAGRTAREKLTDRDSLLGRPVEDPIRVEGESGRVAARAAFELLPQRWQEVLWFLDIQEMHPRDIAPVMGLSPNAVVALHRRAISGLKLAFIRHHSGMNTPASCHKFLADLPAYHARTLKRGRHDDIRHHLARCQACSRIDATFDDDPTIRFGAHPSNHALDARGGRQLLAARLE
jgi:hypothetical protein